jgi:hypothetical protein
MHLGNLLELGGNAEAETSGIGGFIGTGGTFQADDPAIAANATGVREMTLARWNQKIDDQIRAYFYVIAVGFKADPAGADVAADRTVNGRLLKIDDSILKGKADGQTLMFSAVTVVHG